jgi:hypothetical protein
MFRVSLQRSLAMTNLWVSREPRHCDSDAGPDPEIRLQTTVPRHCNYRNEFFWGISKTPSISSVAKNETRDLRRELVQPT